TRTLMAAFQALLFATGQRVDAQVQLASVIRHPRNHVVVADLPCIEMLAAILGPEITQHFTERNFPLRRPFLARAIPLRKRSITPALERVVAAMLGAGRRCSQHCRQRACNHGYEGLSEHDEGFSLNTVNPV